LRENENLILRHFHSSIKFDIIFFPSLPRPPVLVLVFVVYSRRRESHIKYPGPDDDVRENIINYDDEGGGEDDMTAFDITPLQIPIGGPMPELTQCKMPPIMCKYRSDVVRKLQRTTWKLINSHAPPLTSSPNIKAFFQRTNLQILMDFSVRDLMKICHKF
jgi:hypothetical protein